MQKKVRYIGLYVFYLRQYVEYIVGSQRKKTQKQPQL